MFLLGCGLEWLNATVSLVQQVLYAINSVAFVVSCFMFLKLGDLWTSAYTLSETEEYPGEYTHNVFGLGQSKQKNQEGTITSSTKNENVSRL